MIKQQLKREIVTFMNQYREAKKLPLFWGEPILKFASAKDPMFHDLKTVVMESHYLPTDFLPEAVTVLSYFLPFTEEVGKSNVEEYASSYEWAKAYVETNALAEALNQHIVAFLQEQGILAHAPVGIGMVSKDVAMSRWSQRHVAYIAGHGTFGLNNMLISEKGCVGRYYSVITALSIEPDQVVKEERCLYKKNGACKLCVKRCITGALTETGFDRFRCLEQCMENEKRYQDADVCGKCIVGVPCSYRVYP